MSNHLFSRYCRPLVAAFAIFLLLAAPAAMAVTPHIWTTSSNTAAYSIALKSDGTLWVWGDNIDAELGDGTYSVNITVPKQVGTGYTAIFEGGVGHLFCHLAQYSAFPQDQPVTEHYAAARLQRSRAWLQWTRGTGDGPRFCRTNMEDSFHIPRASEAVRLFRCGDPAVTHDLAP